MTRSQTGRIVRRSLTTFAKRLEDLEREIKKLQAQSGAVSTIPLAAEAHTQRGGLEKSQWSSLWYPTVTLNLGIKKTLLLKGVEFLFSRVRAKRIKNERIDLEVTILDEGGNIVAMSSHVA